MADRYFAPESGSEAVSAGDGNRIIEGRQQMSQNEADIKPEQNGRKKAKK